MSANNGKLHVPLAPQKCTRKWGTLRGIANQFSVGPYRCAEIRSPQTGAVVPFSFPAFMEEAVMHSTVHDSLIGLQGYALIEDETEQIISFEAIKILKF
ncbi:MAG: hypothetical protein Q8916_14590 [Bacteroidota bacterium]|nr:hypothetical protein [Bacteroidota bacterium]MDP4236460.1 hypothetical protein [Bacteroidota bacterium]